MYGLTLISSTLSLSQRTGYEKKRSLCNLSNYLNKTLKDHWEDLCTQWNCEGKVPQPWLPSRWRERLLPEIWKRQPTVIPFTPSQSVTNFFLWHLLLLHLVVCCSEMQFINRSPWWRHMEVWLLFFIATLPLSVLLFFTWWNESRDPTLSFLLSGLNLLVNIAQEA